MRNPLGIHMSGLRIDYHKQFQKQYRKLPHKVQQKFAERLEIFIQNPLAPELHNHPLHSEYAAYRSINVTGDFRAIYQISGNKIQFLTIDTHSNLY